MYSSVRLLAEGVAQIPLLQYREQPDGSRLKMPLGKLLSSPSAVLNTFDWLFQYVTSAALQGTAWGLITGRDAYGFPTSVEWLPPEDVQVEDPKPYNPAKVRIYFDEKQIPVSNLLIVRAFTVPGRTAGISPLKAFAMLIESGLDALDYGSGWYKSGGFPPGSFKNTEFEVTEEQSSQVRRKLVNAMRNREPLVYGRDWEYKPISVPPNEAQFVEAMQLNATQIASVYGVPPYRVGGTRGDSMTYCADTETEILSRRGWLRHDQVEQGDVCLTLNTETGLAEWQPVDAMNVFPGPHDVIEMRTGTHSSVTTSGHRWPVWLAGRAGCRDVWRWRTTDDFPVGGRIAAALPGSAPAEQKWSDALAELVAWFWTEGWVGPHGQVVITQSGSVNPENVQRIRAALTALLGPAAEPQVRSRPAWVEDIHRRDQDVLHRFRLNAKAGRVLAEVAPGKVVCPEFLAELTTAQLHLFIEASMAADGSKTAGDGIMAQNSLERLESFQIACALAGKSGVIRGPDRWGMWYMAVQVTPWRKPHGHPEYVSYKTIDGPVWCPTTANGTWFARRAGTTYFTGNSNVESESLGFVTDTLDPWLCRLEAALAGCLPALQTAQFNRNARLRTTTEQRWQWYQIARNVGGMNVDEIRRLEDMDPLPEAKSKSDYDGSDYTPLQIMVAAARGAKELLGEGAEGAAQFAGPPPKAGPAGPQPPELGPMPPVPAPASNGNGNGSGA